MYVQKILNLLSFLFFFLRSSALSTATTEDAHTLPACYFAKRLTECALMQQQAPSFEDAA
jgi:hypothetical protein